MKRTLHKMNLLLFALVLGLAACKKSDDNNTGGSNNNPASTIPDSPVASWVSNNADLPAPYQKDYEKMELTISSDKTYSWLWTKKSGEKANFTGTVSYNKSNFKHTNGTYIWHMTIDVKYINGQSSPGGWIGLYAFETGNVMKLNVEPNVQGWPKYPNDIQGLGSGSDGQNSVYKFTKK